MPHKAMRMWRMAEQHSSSWVHRRAEIVGRLSILTANREGKRAGERSDGGGEQHWKHVVKWNEVPTVADKIILLPWPASLKQFEHNKCCWLNPKCLSDMQINSSPSGLQFFTIFSYHNKLFLFHSVVDRTGRRLWDRWKVHRLRVVAEEEAKWRVDDFWVDTPPQLPAWFICSGSRGRLRSTHTFSMRWNRNMNWLTAVMKTRV